MAAPRTASRKRQTRETNIELELALDGTGRAEIATGLGFLDHMLTSLTLHSRIDLTLRCDGDRHVDDHHTVEDCAIALGEALDEALGTREGIVRFAHAYAPLDEALARCVLDLAARPTACVALALERESLGEVACENLTHFFRSLAMHGRFCLHVDVLRGENDHHRVEAAFKATALALRAAVTADGSRGPTSTKGTLV